MPAPTPDVTPDLSGLRIGFRPASYDPKVFSPRIRAVLPARYLRGAGFEAGIVPRDGSGRYDCVVFQKAYSKRDLEHAAAFQAAGARLIFDLCDNHWYNPSADPAVEARIGQLDRMVEMVDAVTVSSTEIAKLIPSKPVFQVDDALELLPFTSGAARAGDAARRIRRRLGRPARLVWHGQSGNEHLQSGVAPVRELLPELERLHQRTPLSLTIVSNSRRAFDTHIAGAALPTRFVKWRARTFSPRFAQHDICILPIEHNQFTVCKTNNRAMTALLLGTAVVADEIPSYREFGEWMRFGHWNANLEAYIRDPALAADHVRAARAHIERTYTEQRVVEQWRRAIEGVSAAS
jgi:hypothetical protein